MDRDTELEGLIFVSSATKILSYDETETIINFYREDAKAKGITGLVIFASGSILRYVEAEKEIIISQYKLAQKNLQHFNLIKLLQKPIPRRLFPNYPMAFISISQSFKVLSDFDALQLKEYLEKCYEIAPTTVRIINDFIKNNK